MKSPRTRLAGAHLVLWALLAAAFTLVVVRQSLYAGRLAAPPTYDDVTYLADAQARLATLYAEGPAAALAQAFREPPHSPWSAGLAVLAFAAFGMEAWAGAASGAVIIFGVLLWLARRARGLSLAWRLALAAGALTWPLMGHAVESFRPDVACGLAVAATALWIAGAPWVGAPARRHYLAGLGLGLALLIKPTTSPVSAAIVLAALAAATSTDLVRGPSRPWREAAVSWARCLGAGALVAAPYFAVAWRQVVDYVRFHSFGAFSDVWRPDLTRAEAALFYLAGDGGRFLMGAWRFLWPALAAAALALALRNRDRRALARIPAVAAVAVAAYLLVTVPGHKNVFLGAALPGLLFLTGLEMMVYLARSAPVPGTASRSAVSRTAGRAALIGVLAAGVASFGWPAQHAGGMPPAHEIRQHRQLLDEVYRSVRPSDETPVHVFFTAIGPYLNPSLLEYRSGLDGPSPRGTRRLTGSDLQMNEHPADLERELTTADYVVAWSAGNRDAFQWLPGARRQERLLERLRAGGVYVLERTWRTPGGGELYLFGRAAGFDGVRLLEGFGPIEGPYPEWGMPFEVLWGIAPASRFEIEVPAAGAIRLVLDGNSGLPEQTMTVRIAGRVVGVHRFARREEFEHTTLELELAPGRHVVEITYSRWYQPDENDDRPRAVLFRALKALETPAPS